MREIDSDVCPNGYDSGIGAHPTLLSNNARDSLNSLVASSNESSDKGKCEQLCEPIPIPAAANSRI